MFRALKAAFSKVKNKEIGEGDIDKMFSDMWIELVKSDLTLDFVEHLREEVKRKLAGKSVKRKNVKDEILKEMKACIESVFSPERIEIEKMKSKAPVLLLFLGFNGSGKTTALAKLGYKLKKEGKKVLFVAADTFRAASIEQLEEHGKRLNIKVIKHGYGSDPAAVVYDAMRFAESHGYDFVLADTAGRSHANRNLMEELKKVVRVNKPDLKVLVLDSLAGNDIVEQVRSFNSVGVDAFVFTKLDVNEKGGSIISACYELRRPILFLSTGQGYEDVENFDAKRFVEELFPS